MAYATGHMPGYTHTYILSLTPTLTHTYIYCICFFCTQFSVDLFCTLCPIRIWLSGNFWLFFCQILPVCLINFSVFQSFSFSTLLSSLLFCFPFLLILHSAAAFEAQLKYLSNFYRRTLSVQIVCCLLQTYSKYTSPSQPWQPGSRSGPAWQPRKVFCVQIAVGGALRTTLAHIINAMAGVGLL